DAGTLSAKASAPGYAPDSAPSHRDDGSFDVLLARFGRIAGRVVGPDGAPVAGLRIRALARKEPEQDYEFFGSFGRCFEPPVLAMSARPATSDADGRFDMEVAPHRAILVFAEGEGWVTRSLADRSKESREAPPGPTVRVDPGQTVQTAISVDHGTPLSGVVVDDENAPVAGA